MGNTSFRHYAPHILRQTILIRRENVANNSADDLITNFEYTKGTAG